ncbi:MAG TPA: 2'-5' RNA ligase family protein [Candidatus Saccharimonadales bacterium]|nr:2'-5' RNA ligase family protein [Candidatus Saccharimonadales bacterium]
MHKATIVNFIDQVEEGSEFTASSWPLHITLADDFKVDLNKADLLSDLVRFVNLQQPFDVIAAGDGFLGKHSEIAVTFIDTSMHLIRLHRELINFLKSEGAEFYNPHYTIGGYKPHVTIQRLDRVWKSDVIKINNLTLVDMSPSGNQELRRVLKSIHLDA